MANYDTLLKTWGDLGSEYPAGYAYVEGEQPIDAWDNFFASNVVKDIDHLLGLTNKRIETDSGVAGEEPGSPESSHLYHDTDNETLSVWNSTSSAWDDLLKTGAPAGSLTSYPLPAGDINDGAGSGLDADLLDGNEATSFASVASGGTEHPTYATLSDVPTTVTKGDVVYIEDEGRLYKEDGK